MKRIPVTQEYIADMISAQLRGETVTHKAFKYFPNALYDGINKLVHNITHKYKNTISETEEELFQTCFCHLWGRINKYNSERGRFTTFTHWVCTNKIKTYYANNKKLKEHFVDMYENSENQEGSEKLCEFNTHTHMSDSILRFEMANAVRDLINKYPSKKDLTIGILGTPEDIEKRRACYEIKLSSIKGFKKREKSIFFNKTIVPYFKGRFGGIYV